MMHHHVLIEEMIVGLKGWKCMDTEMSYKFEDPSKILSICTFHLKKWKWKLSSSRWFSTSNAWKSSSLYHHTLLLCIMLSVSCKLLPLPDVPKKLHKNRAFFANPLTDSHGDERYIHLHEWLIFMVNLGKYTSPMDPSLGKGLMFVEIPCKVSNIKLST